MGNLNIRGLVGRCTFISIVSALFVSVTIIAFQEVLIFSMVLYPFKATCPKDMICEMLTMQDGVTLELWKGEARSSGALFRDAPVAIIFRGNGGTLARTEFLQKWLSETGVSTYVLDYPGYGNSSGWPEEHKIYDYASEAADIVMTREGVGPDQVIVVGLSLGSGFAANLASKIQPRLLLILAGYADLGLVIRENDNWLYRQLSSFLRFEVPTSKYISQLKNTSVIAVHGDHDQVIPFEHLELNRIAYHGNGQFRTIVMTGNGHNDIFNGLKTRLLSTIVETWSPVGQ